MGDLIAGVQNAVQIKGKLFCIQYGVGGHKDVLPAKMGEILFREFFRVVHGKQNPFIGLAGKPFQIRLHLAIVCLGIVRIGPVPQQEKGGGAPQHKQKA